MTPEEELKEIDKMAEEWKKQIYGEEQSSYWPKETYAKITFMIEFTKSLYINL